MVDDRVQSDWSQFNEDLATSVKEWWSGYEPNLQQLTADLNAEDASATAAVNAIYSAMVDAIGDAVELHSQTIASAAEKLV